MISLSITIANTWTVTGEKDTHTFYYIHSIMKISTEVILLKIRVFMPPRPRPAGGIERLGCPYARTSLRTSSVDQVKCFVQGRISRPINASKLIFHMRMYLHETSRNIQEPWHHDLNFTVH